MIGASTTINVSTFNNADIFNIDDNILQQNGFMSFDVDVEEHLLVNV